MLLVVAHGCRLDLHRRHPELAAAA